MKKLLSIFIVLSFVIFISSCGSSQPDDLPVSQNASATQSYEIAASAGGSTTLKTTFTLNDFEAISKYVKYVKSSVVQGTSFIEVTGITAAQAVELKNVTLSLNSDSGKSVKLTTMTSNNKFNAAPQLTFLQQVMDEIVKRGSSTVSLSFTSTHLITSPVTLSIKLDGQFGF